MGGESPFAVAALSPSTEKAAVNSAGGEHSQVPAPALRALDALCVFPRILVSVFAQRLAFCKSESRIVFRLVSGFISGVPGRLTPRIDAAAAAPTRQSSQ